MGIDVVAARTMPCDAPIDFQAVEEYIRTRAYMNILG